MQLIRCVISNSRRGGIELHKMGGTKDGVDELRRLHSEVSS